jgi:hypothetical protein
MSPHHKGHLQQRPGKPGVTTIQKKPQAVHPHMLTPEPFLAGTDRVILKTVFFVLKLLSIWLYK